MRRVIRIVGLALAVVQADFAFAGTTDPSGYGRPCRVPPGVVSVKSRDELPLPLKKQFSDVAMPGEGWNESDVGLPGQGFTFIWRNHNRWVMDLGHGGIAEWFQLLVYDVSDDGSQAVNVSPRTVGGDWCSTAARFAMYPSFL
jgi:hypothetical protein